MKEKKMKEKKHVPKSGRGEQERKRIRERTIRIVFSLLPSETNFHKF